MNVKIQPVAIQKTPALSMTADNVEVVLTNYQLGGHDAVVYYRLNDAGGQLINEGNIAVGADVVDVWGTDDNVLVDGVLSLLGVTRA